MWRSGIWSVQLQKPIIGLFSMDLREDIIVPPHSQLAFFLTITPQRVRSAKRYEGGLTREFFENIF